MANDTITANKDVIRTYCNGIKSDNDSLWKPLIDTMNSVTDSVVEAWIADTDTAKVFFTGPMLASIRGLSTSILPKVVEFSDHMNAFMDDLDNVSNDTSN